MRRSSGESAPPWRGGRSDDVSPGPSGIADSDDIVMLGLGGSRDEVDDEGDTDPVFIDREALSLVGLQLTAVFAHVEGHLSARRGLGLR